MGEVPEDRSVPERGAAAWSNVPVPQHSDGEDGETRAPRGKRWILLLAVGAVAVFFLLHLIAMPRGGRGERPPAELAIGTAPAAPAAKSATFCVGICAPTPAATLPPSKPPHAGEVQWVSFRP